MDAANVASGFVCEKCGTIMSLSNPAPGRPQTCSICKMFATKPRAPKTAKIAGRWKVRQRKWPRGTPYWIVTDGSYSGITNDNGQESRFPSKEIAQSRADDLNAKEALANG